MSAPILLVDDKRAVARLFELFLKRTLFADVPFLAAETLDAALDILKTTSPRAIFLDNYLPPYTHFAEPAEKIREACDAPIILTTASDLTELGCKDLPETLAGFLSKIDLSSETIEAAIAEVEAAG